MMEFNYPLGKHEMVLNCSQLVPTWSKKELFLIFELLGEHHYDPVYNKIGKEEDLGRLHFVDVGVIRDLLNAMMAGKLARKVTARNSSRNPWIWATDEEKEMSDKLFYQIVRYIIKTWFKRLVGMK